MRSQYRKALFLQEKTINCPSTFFIGCSSQQIFFFILWTLRWYRDDTGHLHHIFMALRHILTKWRIFKINKQTGHSHKYFHQTHSCQQMHIPFHVNKRNTWQIVHSMIVRGINVRWFLCGFSHFFVSPFPSSLITFTASSLAKPNCCCLYLEPNPATFGKQLTTRIISHGAVK